jgi:hypothetical protein
VLNNTAPASRNFADRLLLADPAGVIDHVTVGPGHGEGNGTALAGRTLERLDPAAAVGPETARWVPCTAPAGGTPGCPNSAAAGAVAGPGLAASPNPFAPGSGSAPSLHLRFRVGDREQGYDLLVFDLQGHRVRDLGGDRLGSGPRHVVWDGRDDIGVALPPGGYVVLLRRRDGDGRVVRVEKTLVALVGERR